jgi:aspartyl-tRNA(Asn)/glutamyl-tRNA(Gln) amidotransferase subunit B
MKWEVVIGLETHAQLSTASKIFSGASTAFGAEPNTQASAVDIALPGVLPVLNRGAVERAIRFGLAVNATINRRSVFARKNYFYPDLPKGYQISQYELPIVGNGKLPIMVGEVEKTIRITRAHLEEDAGKSLHENFQDVSGIDLNRAGTPLLEIVTEPDMRSATEAVAYAKTLHRLVVEDIEICDGNMQEGSFRCDANVSVRPLGSDKLGTRCEIKNLNSFRFLKHAIEFEARRQIELLEDGGTVVQETRLYDPDKDETRAMRSKEDAMDYRYFPDPDLPPLEVSEQWIEKIRNALPESLHAKHERYQREFQLSAYDANLLTNSRSMADYYEETVQNLVSLGAHRKDAIKLVASFLTGEFSNILNANQINVDECGVSSEWLASLLIRVHDQTISRNAARAILPGMWATGEKIQQLQKSENSHSQSVEEFSIDEFIIESGIKQISDTGEIEKIVDQVLAANPKSVEGFKAGKEKAFNALVGQVMKATQGNANPEQVNKLLRKKLSA